MADNTPEYMDPPPARSPQDIFTFASTPLPTTKGAKRESADARAVKRAVRRHPRRGAQLAKAYDELAVNPYIGYYNRGRIANVDPELDQLLGNTGYEGSHISDVEQDARTVRVLEDILLNTDRLADPSFAIEHWDDIHLFADDPDTFGYLSQVAAWDKALMAKDREQEAAEEAVVSQFMEIFDLNHAMAIGRLAQFREIQSDVLTAIESMSDEELKAKWGQATGELAEYAEGLRQDYEGAEGAEVNVLAEYKKMEFNERMQKATAAEFGETAEGTDFWDTWQGNAQGLYQRTMAALEWGFGFIEGGIRTGAWILEHASPITAWATDRFTSAMETSGLSSNLEGRQKAIEELRFAANRDLEDVTQEIAADALAQAWVDMKVNDPEQFTEWVAMGGDERTARAMWSAAVVDRQYGGFSVMDEARTAAENLQKEVHGQLQQLEDSDYTFSDSLMDILVVYGEWTNDIATATTAAGKAIFDAQFKPDELTSFAEEFAKGTPSAVLGIEGTFIGLGFDFLMNGLADPLTWLFGPSLAGAGRHGATTPELAMAAVRSPTAQLVRQNTLEMIRSTARSALATATVLDKLGNTGLAARYLAAARGFVKPLIGRWANMEKWGTRVSDVYVPSLSKMLPEGELDDFARQAAQDALEAGTYEPVVISVNPETGAYKITEGADLVRAADGTWDNIKATIKIDSELTSGTGWAPGMAQADVDLLERIASGTADDIVTKDAKGYPMVQSDEMTRGALLTNATTYDGVPVGAIETKSGEVLKIMKFDGDDQIYWAVNRKNEVVGAVEINSNGVGGQIAVEESMVGQGVLGKMFEEIRLNIDEPVDLLPMLAKDSQLSMDAAEWIVDQAQRRVTEAAGAGQLPTADWVGFKGTERARELDGSSYVNPRHMLPEEELYGFAPDHDMLRALEYQHIINGGQPMHGRGMAMSVSIGQAIGEHLNRYGVTSRLVQWMTPMNNSGVLRFTGPNSFSRINNFMARLWGAVNDMDSLEVYLTRIIDEFAERGKLEARAQYLSFQHELLGHEIDNMLPQQRPLINADGTTQRFGVIEDTPIPADDAAAQALGFGDLEDYFIAEFRKHGIEWELKRPTAEPQFEGPPQGVPRQPELFPNPQERLVDDMIGEQHRVPEPPNVQSQYREAAARLERLRTLDDFDLRQRYQLDPIHESAVQARKQLRELEDKRIALRMEQDAVIQQLNDYGNLATIMKEMLDDYNRRYLATNKKWKDFVDEETGLVDLEKALGRTTEDYDMLETVLRKASETNITAMEALDTLGIEMPKGVRNALELLDTVGHGDMGRYLNQMLGSKRALSSFQLPASPLELIAASVDGPAALRKIGAMKAVEWARNKAHAAHTLWMVDKVLTPRTGIVVALDELMRIWQKGGLRAVGLWLEDRAISAAQTFSKLAGDDTFAALPQRWQQRIRALQEIPDYYRDIQRSILETHGYGVDSIKFQKGTANTDYYAAAQQQSMNMVRDPGFAAYLQGEEAFRQWFLTDSKASYLRGIDYFDNPTLTRQALPHWKDVYDGYHSMFEYATNQLDWIKKDKARKLYTEATERYATRQAVGPMPNWVLEGYGEVVGAARVPTSGWARPVDWVSERLFQRPMNYRQGFLAEMVRKSEWARLEKMYKARGIEIVTDDQIVRQLALKYPTIPDELLRGGLDYIADDLATRFNMVSRRRLDDMVEAVVEQEMEQTLYAFHRQSELGRHSRALFPFGRPWADMWGHWGREMITRPQLRGWLNESNFLNIRTIAENLVDTLPVNPKTAGFVSRVANVDMDLDNIENDPLFGSVARGLGIESLDVGRAMFLPNKGESPFLSMFPGFGIVPTVWGEKLIMSKAPDPVEQPQEFQRYISQYAQLFPGVGFNRPTTSRGAAYDLFIGGGVTNRFFDFFDSLGLWTGQWDFGVKDSLTTDWKTTTANARAIKVKFSDPAVWEELMELSDNFAGPGLQALLNETLSAFHEETSRQVGGQRFLETGLEFMFPVAADTLTQSEELRDVWIDNMDVLPLSDEFKNRLNLSTEEGKDKAAEAISSFWWDQMTPTQRDLILINNPQLVVNTVSQWVWTDVAKNDPNIVTDFPYQSGGSTTARARHKTYIQQGWIQPATERQLAINMIGTIADARNRIAADFYEASAQMVNQQRWEYLVPDWWKEWAGEIANELSRTGNAPYTEPYDIWRNFSKVSDIIWELQGRPMREDGSPNKYTIPTGKEGFEPWGETLPSSRDDLRRDFAAGYELPGVTDEMKEMAHALNIYIAPGIEMATIYQKVANYRADTYTDNPVFAQFLGPYRAWLAPKGSGEDSMWEVLGKAVDHEDVDPQARVRLKQAQLYVATAVDLYRSGNSEWLGVADQAKEYWESLKYDDYLRKLGLDDLWNTGVGDTLGPLDWTPDEPSPLYDESGGLVAEAQRVLPTQIYDGDTIHFQTSPDRKLFGPLGGPTVTQEEFSLRTLGNNAREMGEEGGEEDRQLLVDAIMEALDNNIPIYIVRDPERYGNTDFYGRVFGWLYIGDEPYVRPETQMPRR